MKEVKEITNMEQNEELLVKTDIEGTPFTVISVKDTNEHFGVMGKYRITETHDTKEEVIDILKQITWNRIVQVILLITDHLNKTK